MANIDDVVSSDSWNNLVFLRDSDLSNFARIQHKFEQPSLARRIYEPFRYAACKIFEYCVAGSLAPDIREKIDFNDGTATYGDPRDAAAINAYLSYVPVIAATAACLYSDSKQLSLFLSSYALTKIVETTYRTFVYNNGGNPRGSILGELASVPLRKFMKDKSHLILVK